MPGAGGRLAANWLYNVAPKDGTFIGNVYQNTAIDQAMKEKEIRYDIAEFNWIGNPLVINSTILTWTASGLNTIADVKAKGGLICGGSAGTASIINPQILNNLIGTGIRIIAGYQGNPDVGLAMERGEVNCLGSSNLSSARVMFAAHLADHRMSILVQWGTQKDPAISAYAGHDVPLVSEFAQNDMDRKVLDLINSGITFGRPLLAPPGVPRERIEALRQAFDATMKDPEFLADAQAQTLDVNPISGAKLQRLATTMAATPDALVARANELVTLRDVTGDKK
jgi:tripartite-type tricarboxylate transporter receptor subunit TctC